MKNNQPEFVLIYACKKCGLDTAFIEQVNKIICPYCHSCSRMVLLQRNAIAAQKNKRSQKKVDAILYQQ